MTHVHVFVALSYWFMKDQYKKWLPVGTCFGNFVNDIARVWPGAGKKGLALMQVGVSMPLSDVVEPHMPLTACPAPAEQDSDSTIR